MRVLDKHPAPWTRHESGSIVDGNGRLVLTLGTDDLEAVEHLIFSAPVLLECLRVFVDDHGPLDLTPFNLLIDWLDGTLYEGQRIDLGEFVKWLRGGQGNIIALIEGGDNG